MNIANPSLDAQSALSLAAEPHLGVAGADTILPLSVEEPGCGSPAAAPDSVAVPLENPLLQYSLYGQLEQLKARSVAAKPVLGEIALAGQSTVLYAEPNTGKTLLTLRLLVDSIAEGNVDPDRAFYVNMDDSSEGLLQKGVIAERSKFHMLAGGENNFQPQLLIGQMQYMAQNHCARGCLILIDTLKKLVDLMQKSQCAEFGTVVRAFTQAGGTVIALAHTNKNKSPTGKAVHGGTADIIQDFDCSYLMTAAKGSDGTVIVKFENAKKRGNVALEASYSYADTKGISYEDRFESVKILGEAEAVQVNYAAQRLADDNVVKSLIDFIAAGTTAKKELMESVSKIVSIGREKVGEVIDRYCGTDEAKHVWSMTKLAHGAHHYKLLPKYSQF